jgi:hypothetical protein
VARMMAMRRDNLKTTIGALEQRLADQAYSSAMRRG